MKKGIVYWENELKEWEKFFYEFGDELSNSELIAVIQRMSKIDDIIDTYLPWRIGAKW